MLRGDQEGMRKRTHCWPIRSLTTMGSLFRKDRVREAMAGYLFLLPNFIGFLVFVLVPVVASLIFSFHDYNVLSKKPAEFIGMKNYTELVGFTKEEVVEGNETRKVVRPNDHRFWAALYNTLYVMAIIPVTIMGSLFLAVLLNSRIKGVVFFRTVFFEGFYLFKN